MTARFQPGWRHLLRTHSSAFLAWLHAETIFERAFGVLANDLESFLLCILNEPRTGDVFMQAIPDVLRRCNDDIYDLPLRPEAYAFIHLLERYRRTWRVLEELTRLADLPLARYGVRTLDVGTGPAPVLYAVNDFYGSLRWYAASHGIESLRLPMPELSAVEGSRGMARFVHHFSEWARRTSGPFGADWQDFEGFDPAGRRAARLKARVTHIADEDDVSDAFARWWVDQNEGWHQGLHTYRLCFFSNFLTTPELLERFQDRVNAAFGSITPGGVVVITGSDAPSYHCIYATVQAMADTVGFRRLEAQQTFDPPDHDPCAPTIKQLYAAVWNRLDDLGAARPDLIKHARDVWEPDEAYKNTRFALRAYRHDGASG